MPTFDDLVTGIESKSRIAFPLIDTEPLKVDYPEKTNDEAHFFSADESEQGLH
jgi:hypothetical protein